MIPVIAFASKLNARIILDPKRVVEKKGRYFLLRKNLQDIAQGEFYYAGTYLGKEKKGKFFPSFHLLAVLAETDANKIFLNKKAAWLFICGRDIFCQGITAVRGSRQKDSFTLVLNEFNECLGFGRILCDLDLKGIDLAVSNVSDIGDFLRRERNLKGQA